MNNSSPLYLVDGSGYLFRAFYAIRHLSSPDGFPTNAIYGVIQMILKLVRDVNPEHLAVVFDVGRETFRTEMYPEYKANRAAMPEEMKPQIEPLKEIIRAFNIPVLEMKGYEADDLIGTIARKCQLDSIPVVVVTGDKDLMQIVGNGITLFDTMKDKRIGIEEVGEKFGVTPEHVVDVLSLMGDSSDNIPGVPGIGEKTAIKLIQEFGSLENLLARSNELKGKVAEKVQENVEKAKLSYRLATIDCNVPLNFDFNSFKVESPDREKLSLLFKRFGFTSLIKDITGEATLSAEDYITVSTDKDLDELVKELEVAEIFAFDTETSSLDTLEAELIGMSFSCKPHKAWYVPLRHRNAENSEQMEADKVLQKLIFLIENDKTPKIGQNIKYDYKVLRTAGFKPSGMKFDTMIASYLLNPARNSHGLDSLSMEILNHKMIPYSEITDKAKIQFADIPVSVASRYAAEDADATFLLYKNFRDKLADSGMEELFSEVEMPLVTILAEMEYYGVLLDIPLLNSLSEHFKSKLSNLEKGIYSEAGEEFNINSPKQLGEILFDRMKLPTGKKTKLKTGWSTNADELERLAALNTPVAAMLLEYRTLNKLKSTYTDTLPKMVSPVTGRVHTSYNQTVTATGRLSSSDPNLQNIPVRNEEGKLIRRAFTAPDGHLILSADYSQIELRILAHLSKDPVFCDSFEKDEDIHSRTAAEVFEIFPEMVTSEMRRQAKTINFGVIYGQSAFSLSQQLGISRKSADDFITRYKQRYSKAMEFLDSCIFSARENGFVTTILGRRLPISEINSSNYVVKGYAERNAINYPIQGSAADIIKIAMIKIDHKLKDMNLKTKMIMQVHDELVFEVPESELIEVEKLVDHEMSNAVELAIPLKVDIGYGKNWSEAH